MVVLASCSSRLLQPLVRTLHCDRRPSCERVLSSGAVWPARARRTHIGPTRGSSCACLKIRVARPAFSLKCSCNPTEVGGQQLGLAPRLGAAVPPGKEAALVATACVHALRAARGSMAPPKRLHSLARASAPLTSREAGLAAARVQQPVVSWERRRLHSCARQPGHLAHGLGARAHTCCVGPRKARTHPPRATAAPSIAHLIIGHGGGAAVRRGVLAAIGRAVLLRGRGALGAPTMGQGQAGHHCARTHSKRERPRHSNARCGVARGAPPVPIRDGSCSPDSRAARPSGAPS